MNAIPSPRNCIGAHIIDLNERGLLEAEDSGGRWYVRSVVAEWMLASPPLATQINAAYDRAYPDALSEATGLTVEVLTNANRWERALVGRRRWRPGAGNPLVTRG